MNSNNIHKGGLHAIGLQMEKVGTQILIAMFKPPKLQVLISLLGFTKGHSFDFGLGSRLVQKLGSSAEGSRNPTTQTITPNCMDEVAIKVM